MARVRLPGQGKSLVVSNQGKVPAWAEDASELCVCFVLSSADADVGSDFFLAQAMASESRATNNMVALHGSSSSSTWVFFFGISASAAINCDWQF